MTQQNNTSKSRIVFFGTPEFALPILDALYASGYPIVAVVSAPDARVGRKQILTPPPVRVWAEQHNIPVLQPETLKNFELRIKNYGPELGVVAAYGKIIPAEILMVPKYGFLNVHPSLLPKYRGPTPIQSAILAGEKITGITIHLTTEKLDAGPIIKEKRLEIRDEETYQELAERLAQLGAEILIETIPLWLEGKIEPKEQNNNEATYTKKFTREDGRIDFERKDSDEVIRMTGALNPNPGTFFEALRKDGTALAVNPHTHKGVVLTDTRFAKQEMPIHPLAYARDSLGVEVKLIKATNAKNTANAKPGTFFELGNKLAVVCKNFQALLLDELQPAGAKVMSSEEFLRGHRWIVAKQ